MRHLMPIVTPRLVLRPPILDDLDAIQAAKEDTWNDLQLWMAWAFDNQRPRQALEHSIRRTMNFQSQASIALAGLHRINGDFVRLGRIVGNPYKGRRQRIAKPISA